MKFLLVAASVIAVTYGHSPVLLWPAKEFAVPDGQSALDSMNLDDFKKLFDGKKIVVFHKKQFLLEEVSYPKKQLSYLQSVDAIALQGVKSIHHFVGGLTSSNNLEFVRLVDGPLDEQQEEEIKNKMESKPGFAAILLGSGSHKSRRAAENKFACTSEANDPCMAYVGAIEMSDEKLVGTCKVACQGGSGLTITISGGTEPVELTVKNDVESGGYNLGVSSPYNIDSETTWAPKMFSYSCSALRLIPRVTSAADKKPTITLSRLQVWPDRRDKDHPQKDEFPESYDCATWFTPATWMGVMIAMFYIFLLFGAVVFLLDVKTNDRFDDPKGKTITVNVAE